MAEVRALSKPFVIEDAGDIPEELLDARQWERMDENTLYELCVHFINVGIANGRGQAHVTDAGELVVTNWEFGAPGWNSAVRQVQKRAKLARTSRKHRKAVQGKVLAEAAAKEAAARVEEAEARLADAQAKAGHQDL